MSHFIRNNTQSPSLESLEHYMNLVQDLDSPNNDLQS